MTKTRTPSRPASAANELDLLGLDVPFDDIEIEFPDFEVEMLDFDVDAPPTPRAPAPAMPSAPITMPAGTGHTVRTTIRLPRGVVEDFKRRAADGGKRYQTLIVTALREWLAGPGAPRSTS